MLYHILADLTVLLHFLFIMWIGFGVFFLKHHPRIRIVHLACVLWGLAIEIRPFLCPLTHAELWLRERGEAPGYRGDFIAHYLERIVYIEAPREALLAVAAAALAVTAALNVRWGFRAPYRAPIEKGRRNGA